MHLFQLNCEHRLLGVSHCPKSMSHGLLHACTKQLLPSSTGRQVPSILEQGLDFEGRLWKKADNHCMNKI